MRFAHPEPFWMQCASRAQMVDILGLQGNERTLGIWGRSLATGGYCAIDDRRHLVLYSFYDLPPEGLEELLSFVVEWQPEVIFGYVSLLCTVADALIARGVDSLHVPMIRAHAERLYDWQREKLARAFGGEVYDHYGSCEISDYGVECRAHRGIHLFSNLRLFELDGACQDNPSTGELLVTDFANPAMPFIRYRNGDVLTIDRTPCACGRSLPRATVQARSVDLIRLRDGRMVCSLFLHELMDPDQVTRYLLHQRSYDRVDLHLVPAELFSEGYRDHVLARIQEVTGMTDIRLILRDELDVKIGGKHRLVRSDVSSQMAAG
jgi:phenylacetate-CoA ligase